MRLRALIQIVAITAALAAVHSVCSLIKAPTIIWPRGRQVAFCFWTTPARTALECVPVTKEPTP